MRFWWVNQNQTFRQEIGGQYMWSPKRNSHGGRNPFYESMREVTPGDVIFSFSDTLIKAIGIAKSYCHECPKPPEFGNAGPNWNQIGWKVDVEWRLLHHQIRPKSHIDLLRPHLPARYSPLRETGDGLQGVYLTNVPSNLAYVLGGLVGLEFKAIVSDLTADEDPSRFIVEDLPSVDDWEEHLQQEITANDQIPDTEKTALVQARRGQGIFKRNVSKIEKFCRVTKVNNPTHLIASHCKPWRDSGHQERLDGENGLLLTPSIDHLFDRGFISFDEDGDLLISPVAHKPSLVRLGIETNKIVNVGGFSDGQQHYLEFHRTSVFLKAKLN